MKLHLVIAALSACLFTTLSRAAPITFETTPAGTTPVDNELVNDPYSIAGGGTVHFYFDVNKNNVFDAGIDRRPAFEAIGQNPVDGFVTGRIGPPTDPNAIDHALPRFEAQLGNFFLRSTADVTIAPFIIQYDTMQTISAFSGEIWDIDGVGYRMDSTEQWLVEALNSSNTVLAATLSPLGLHQLEPLDGEPWVFSFNSLPVGVDKIRLTFVGQRPFGGGFSFNNFDPTFPAVSDPNLAVPEPSSLVLAFVCSLLGFGRLYIRRLGTADLIRASRPTESSQDVLSTADYLPRIRDLQPIGALSRGE